MPEQTPRSMELKPQVVEGITEEQFQAQFQWLRTRVNDDVFREMLRRNKGDILMLAAEVEYPEQKDLSQRTKLYDRLKIAGAELLKKNYWQIEPDEIANRMVVAGDADEANLRAYVLAQIWEESLPEVPVAPEPEKPYDWLQVLEQATETAAVPVVSEAAEPEGKIPLIEDDLQANASELKRGRHILQQSTISNAEEIVWRARVKELEEKFERIFGIAEEGSFFRRAFDVADASFTSGESEKNDLFEYRDRLVKLGIECCAKGEVTGNDEEELGKIFIVTQKILLDNGKMSKFVLQYFIQEFEELIPHGPELGPGEPEEPKRQATDELPDWLKPQKPEEKKSIKLQDIELPEW